MPVRRGSNTGDTFAGRDNKFKDGALYFQTGANAGAARRSLSHTYNTPTAPDARHLHVSLSPTPCQPPMTS
jgi:hypothetical protein